MRLETRPGEVHRLVVTLGLRDVVYAARHFTRFEQAQAHVADAVRHSARQGHVKSVTLQRGTPICMSAEDAGGPAPRRWPASVEYTWTIEKRWETDVIQRILKQNGTALSSGSHTFPASALKRWRTPARPVATRHKPARWHLAATAAFVLVAVITLLLFQTGGRPLALLAALRDRRPAVKRELPFDARTSFTQASQGDDRDTTQPASDEPSLPEGND